MFPKTIGMAKWRTVVTCQHATQLLPSHSWRHGHHVRPPSLLPRRSRGAPRACGPRYTRIEWTGKEGESPTFAPMALKTCTIYVHSAHNIDAHTWAVCWRSSAHPPDHAPSFVSACLPACLSGCLSGWLCLYVCLSGGLSYSLEPGCHAGLGGGCVLLHEHVRQQLRA